MSAAEKGKSPFYPGQPVPVELFTGRQRQIDHILNRGAAQVAAGKPASFFVQGEYGIGKSSVAGFVQRIAEQRFGLHAIYASLGTAASLDDVGAAILDATIRSGAFNPGRAEKVRDWLSKYIGEQSLFGFTVRADRLRRDAPDITSGLLPFLEEAVQRLASTGVQGIFLVLDEINGISSNPRFGHFLKGIVDTNALARKPLPLLLMLCGVEERRREMIRHYQPIDRIFDVVDVEPMSDTEMKDFFAKSFGSVRVQIDPDAMDVLIHFSAGFPKIMHMVGDAAFWLDQDGVIAAEEASLAVIDAAEDVGRKYVDQQVYKALRSQDYRSILKKIASTGLDMSFRRADIAKRLTEAEQKKLDNFLQKMKKLNVLRQGDHPGEYVFNVRMVRLYIWLASSRKPEQER